MVTLVRFVRKHKVEYVVLDHDLMKDCPQFLQRVRPEHLRLLFNDLPCRGRPCYVFQANPQLQAAGQTGSS